MPQSNDHLDGCELDFTTVPETTPEEIEAAKIPDDEVEEDEVDA